VSIERRTSFWRTSAVLLGVVLAVAAAFVPMPFLELRPGPTYNVVGTVDGKPLLKIDGATTYPTSGHLDMTTVSERGGPDDGVLTGRVLAGWLDPATRVLPREAFYPDAVSGNDVEQQTAEQFSDSTATAVAAAAHHLDMPVREVTIVAEVVKGAPADGELEPGDEILEVRGQKISEPRDVTAAMTGAKPGDTVRIVVRRGQNPGERKTFDLVTVANPDDPSRAFMGIAAGSTYRTTFQATVTLDGVGGPSAGLFFSLGIVDLLTPGALSGGKYIAGTGTIDADGTVGPIGGIEQKMRGARSAGATLFLVPADNCSEALESGVPSGLTIAKVSTLDDAVTQIQSYVAGRPLTSCGP